MAPIMEVSDDYYKECFLSRASENGLSRENLNRFYISSIEVYVHKGLPVNGERMLTGNELKECLKYAREHHRELYDQLAIHFD